MKKFTMLLLGAIFVALIAGSIQSISADDLKPKQVFSKNEKLINFSKDAKQVSFSSTKDSKYLIHLQVVVRNAQGQLISVSETMDGKYLVHEITDYVFDAMSDKSDKKEITVIDNMKYQRIHLTQIKNVQQMTLEGVRYDDIQSKWFIEYCVETNEQCDWHIAFATLTSHISLEEDDVVTIHWTVLRAMN